MKVARHRKSQSMGDPTEFGDINMDIAATVNDPKRLAKAISDLDEDIIKTRAKELKRHFKKPFELTQSFDLSKENHPKRI